MKFKTHRQRVAGEYTRDGVTIPVPKTIETTIPVLPRNWQAIAVRSTVGIVVALTVIAIVWSTWSIGSLLGGGIGYAVAVIFDIGWIAAILLEYLSRYDETKRAFPTRLGWVLLVVTMVAIGWHGIEEGSIAMAIVGAFVSFFAKILWIGVMKHVNAELSDDDKAWLAHQISAAQTKAALATVRRQTARIEQTATLELLAMEHEKANVAKAFGLDTTTVTAQIETPEAKSERPALERPTLADMKVSDAIRFIKNQYPALEASEVVEILEDEGIEATRDYVTQVFKRMTSTDVTEELADVVNLRK